MSIAKLLLSGIVASVLMPCKRRQDAEGLLTGHAGKRATDSSNRYMNLDHFLALRTQSAKRYATK